MSGWNSAGAAGGRSVFQQPANPYSSSYFVPSQQYYGQQQLGGYSFLTTSYTPNNISRQISVVQTQPQQQQQKQQQQQQQIFPQQSVVVPQQQQAPVYSYISQQPQSLIQSVSVIQPTPSPVVVASAAAPAAAAPASSSPPQETTTAAPAAEPSRPPPKADRTKVVMRVISATIKKGREHAFCEVFDEDVIAVIGQQEGYCECDVMISGSELVVAEMWTNDENCQNAQELLASEWTKLKNYFEAPPSVKTFHRVLAYQH